MRKFADGDVVYVAHKRRMVRGEVVRYDNGKPYKSPFYVVDVGEYESVIVPEHVLNAGEDLMAFQNLIDKIPAL